MCGKGCIFFPSQSICTVSMSPGQYVFILFIKTRVFEKSIVPSEMTPFQKTTLSRELLLLSTILNPQIWPRTTEPITRKLHFYMLRFYFKLSNKTFLRIFVANLMN